MPFTFQVVTREVSHVGGQITADVVRSDGKTVRSGMWPRSAEVECDLLNRMAKEGWSNSKFFAERQLAHVD